MIDQKGKKKGYILNVRLIKSSKSEIFLNLELTFKLTFIICSRYVLCADTNTTPEHGTFPNPPYVVGQTNCQWFVHWIFHNTIAMKSLIMSISPPSLSHIPRTVFMLINRVSPLVTCHFFSQVTKDFELYASQTTGHNTLLLSLPCFFMEFVLIQSSKHHWFVLLDWRFRIEQLCP